MTLLYTHMWFHLLVNDCWFSTNLVEIYKVMNELPFHNFDVIVDCGILFMHHQFKTHINFNLLNGLDVIKGNFALKTWKLLIIISKSPIIL